MPETSRLKERIKIASYPHVLAVFVVVVPTYLGGRSYLVASLFGLAMMALTVAYLARLVRRR